MRFSRRFPNPALVAGTLAALAALWAPGPARAQGCPLYSFFTTSPGVPNQAEPTSVTIFGCSPCASVVSSSILTGTQVEVVLHHEASCPDTVSVWSATFDFGVLAAGSYNLVITVRDEATPQVGEVFGTYFTVAGDPPPPPPPPPPLPPTPTGPLFMGITTEPLPATTAASTVLVAYGTYPFWCGFVSTAEVLAPDHVALTLRQFADCSTESPNFTADSLWTRAFDLGVLAAGRHDMTISIRSAVGLDSLDAQDFAASFDVIDAGAPPPPPPPPPPIDSVSAPQPNPFADQTEVGLIVKEDTDVQVGIFDVAGRRVKDIYRGPLAAGSRTYAWDGRRDNGERARPGVYFYRVVQPGRAWTRRVVLLPGR